MGGFEIPKLNLFQQPVQRTGAIGTQGSQGIQRTGGSQNPFGVSGGSAVDRELAEFRNSLPAFNGTGELRPNNADPNATLKMLYA
ncbi:MAG: hypothetical protein KHX03_05775 [Clostridium sp.]|nr:hypothetical protein [Clostridium sp.]